MIPIPTASEFRAFMTEELACAKKELDPDKEDFMPHLLVWHVGQDLKRTRTLCMIASGFNEADEKYGALLMCGKKFAEDRQFPVGAVMVSEAWMAHQAPGEDHVQPRHNPNREEVLIAFGGTIDRKVFFDAHIPVARVRGLMRPLSDWRWMDEKVNPESPLLMEFFRGVAIGWEERIKAKH